MRMSVTTTSYKAASSFFFAASPEFTVSTLCPSRRRAMSSISQIERSSSQTRMLPMDSSYCSGSHLAREGGLRFALRIGLGGHVFDRVYSAQTKDKDASFTRTGTRPHFALMCLNDLVHDRQPKSRTTFEFRLKRFEYLFRQLGGHAGA